MSNKSFIDSVEVKSPCIESWDQMYGTDKIRFCSHCTKHVNNLSEMTQKEAMRFVRASDGNICIRYHVNPVTKRPLFAEQLFQITRRTPGIAAGMMTASISLSTASYAQSGQQPVSTPVVVTSTQNPDVKADGDQKVGETITSTQIENLPLNEERFTTMGGVMVAVEYSSPLTRAVANEDVDEVRDQISKGANVNGKDENYTKITALFIAVENGNIEIVEMLLNAGAKVNARDGERQTPLMRLDYDATPDLISLLVSHRVKINLVDNEGNTAVILAAGRVKPNTLQALIDAGADVRLGNKEGRTALMNATENSDLEAVRMLIFAGSDVNAKNKEGESVWDHASDEEVLKLLESYGAVASEKAPEQTENK